MESESTPASLLFERLVDFLAGREIPRLRRPIAGSGVAAVRTDCNLARRATPKRSTGSGLHPDATAENRAGRNPAVDSSPVVADLEPRALDRLNQMQVLRPVHFAEHDV